MMTHSRLLALTVLASVLLVSSCNDEKDCPICPGQTPTPDATLANIWPGEDSLFWAFDYIESVSDWNPVVYQSEDAVPPLPSFADLGLALSQSEIPDSTVTGEGIYRLRFDGTVSTESGVTAKLLREELLADQYHYPASQNPFEAAIMTRLWYARPDLRARLRPILQKMGTSLPPNDLAGNPDGAARTTARLFLGPMLLHGYAWAKTNDWIGTYGDLNTEVAWKFLEYNLTVGHEFTLQLVPDLADDVLLHARILSNGRTVRTPLGSFEKVVRCGYILDYGLSIATDETGSEVGFIADYDYGTVSYAPTVGPIQSYEVRLADRGNPDHEGLGRLRVDLIGRHTP